MDDNIPSLDDLLKSIQEDGEDIPGLDDLLDDIRNEGEPQSSSALAVVPKKEDDLVEEEIDSQILSILGLEDVFDLTYEEYYRELRTAAAAGRMPGSQMSTESIELITEELKRVKGKTGRFKVKQKKIDINKVLDRKQPTPPGAIVKAQKLIPTAPEVEPEQPEKKTVVTPENLQDDLLNGIGNILESLITIRTLMQNQSEGEQKIAEEEAKKTNKQKKKERESALEKKKPKSPIVKAVAKPVIGFFDAIKKFFTNVVLGSVVLGLFKWLNDPNNKESIDKFTNFLENNAGLILGGLLAIAAIPLVSTILGFLTPITAIAIPAITAAFGFLASPVGLAALAGLAGLGAAGLAVKGVETVGKKFLYGGGDLVQANEILDKKLAAAGITKQGKDFSKGHQQQRKRKVSSGKQLTPEQEKILQEVEAERARLKDIRKRMDAEIKAEMDKVEPTGREVRGGRQFTAEDQRRREEAKERVIQKYNKEINLDKGETVPTSTSTSTPKPQPQTPLMPGPFPSAAQPKTESAGNRDGSGVVKVVPASHPDTGSGYTVEGQIDQSGRPVVFSNPAAQQFAKAVEDSGMNLGQYIASSGRSEAKNASLKGADPNSHHMYGEAIDMNGAGYEWMKANGSKYGWKYVYNHGPGSAHFKYVGPGAGSTPKLSPPGSAPAPPSAKITRTTAPPSAQVERTPAPTPKPKPQPQTPLMPGLPPSAAQPGAGPADNPVGGSASSSLSRAASDLRGMSSAAGPDGGKNGCVWAVNKVFARAGIKTPWGSSNYVPTAEQEMIKSGYQRVSSPSPGDIYVAPGEKHIGIVLDNGNIISNSSSGAKFSWEASPTSYASYYGGSGRYYRIPPSVVATGQPSVDRAAQVERTPAPTPSIPSPTGRGNIVPLPIPTGGGAQQASSGTASNQAPVPSFSSIDPNNATTMVVRAIYNIVG